jgi:osmoprotectant transport system ATP-binding protein
VVVDDQRRPQGWVRGADLPAEDVPIDGERLVAGGSLYNAEADSLREALDAALSSPSGLGVAVDSRGAVVGSVTADDVLERLAAVRAEEAVA